MTPLRSSGLGGHWVSQEHALLLPGAQAAVDLAVGPVEFLVRAPIHVMRDAA